MTELRDELIRAVREDGIDPDSEACDRLACHAELILGWNRSARLVSGQDASPAGLARHYRDAGAALAWLPPSGRVIDLGSGGGFPGLVWGCLRPDLEIVLVEAAQRKAAFLRDAVRELNLPRVRVEHRRIATPEALARLDATLWTSRASGQAGFLLGAAGDPGSEARRPDGIILYLGESDAAGLCSTPRSNLVVQARRPRACGRPGEIVLLRVVS